MIFICLRLSSHISWKWVLSFFCLFFDIFQSIDCVSSSWVHLIHCKSIFGVDFISTVSCLPFFRFQFSSLVWYLFTKHATFIPFCSPNELNHIFPFVNYPYNWLFDLISHFYSSVLIKSVSFLSIFLSNLSNF